MLMNGGTVVGLPPVEILFTYGTVSVDLESLSLGTRSVAMNNFRWNVRNVANGPTAKLSRLEFGSPFPTRETRISMELRWSSFSFEIARCIFLSFFFFN